MRNDHDAAFKLFDGKSQCINGTHIQMVGGFVYPMGVASIVIYRNNNATYPGEGCVGVP